jgi:acetyl-CoA C-acetyltransferase
MWKIAVGFAVFAGLALYVISKGGDNIDMTGEKHGAEAVHAPAPAARKALERAGLSVADIDVWEINEAFAVVTEKAIRDLGIDRSKVNINGGSIALGHPIGATGSILIGTALDELERSGGRYGLITMCAFGGMAPAMIIERI